MDINKTFSELVVNQLKAKRIELGLKQFELAQKIKMSPTIYGHIESKRRELKIFELYQLTNILNIDISKLLNSIDTYKDSNEKINSNEFKRKIIAFTSFKGGVGVSTLAVLTANEISKNYKILLIDSTEIKSCYNLRQRDLEVYPDTEPLYEIKEISIYKLSKVLDILKKDYDYIILDLPRFFYFEEIFDEILLKSDFVFAPFHLERPYLELNENINFNNYLAGRPDLFFELKHRIVNVDDHIKFVLIPFKDEVNNTFKEWCENEMGVEVIPTVFKHHEEFYYGFDTMNFINPELDAPYIQNVKHLLYDIKRVTKSDPIIEDTEILGKLRIKAIINHYKKK